MTLCRRATKSRAATSRAVSATGSFVAGGLLMRESDEAFAQQGPPPTPACDDHGELTLAETEGPYFKPHSPRRADLRTPGISGHPVELSGLVLTVPAALSGRPSSIFGMPTTRASMTTEVSACAAMSSPTPTGATLFAPFCRGSIRAAPATTMSRSRLPVKPC